MLRYLILPSVSGILLPLQKFHSVLRENRNAGEGPAVRTKGTTIRNAETKHTAFSVSIRQNNVASWLRAAGVLQTAKYCYVRVLWSSQRNRGKEFEFSRKVQLTKSFVWEGVLSLPACGRYQQRPSYREHFVGRLTTESKGLFDYKPKEEEDQTNLPTSMVNRRTQRPSTQIHSASNRTIVHDAPI